MKLIITGLILANISFAHLNCQNFARNAPTQSDQANLANANTCSKEVSKALKAKIKAADSSTSDCDQALEELKKSILEAKDFQSSAKAALAFEGPSEKIKRKFQENILDLTYALTDDLESKACDEIEFIEVKSEAQTEVLVLERTTYSLP